MSVGGWRELQKKGKSHYVVNPPENKPEDVYPTIYGRLSSTS